MSGANSDWGGVLSRRHLSCDWQTWQDVDALRLALRNYIETYPTCPCGAWIGQENERPHVIGCPVELATRSATGPGSSK